MALLVGSYLIIGAWMAWYCRTEEALTAGLAILAWPVIVILALTSREG